MFNPLLWCWDAAVCAWLHAVYAPAFMLGQTVPQKPDEDER